MLSLFTVTVTALLDPAGYLDPVALLALFTESLDRGGLKDAAVTMGSSDISFTAQVEAVSAEIGIERMLDALPSASYAITAIAIAPFKEEEVHGADLISLSAAV